MKNKLTLNKVFQVLLCAGALSFAATALAGDPAPTGTEKEDFVAFAEKIPASAVEALPILSNGRIKPLDSYAREALMYLTGKYRWWGLSSAQTYLGLITFEPARQLEIIEVRDPELREQLGFSKKKRFFSLNQLETTALESLVRPLAAREERNDKTLTGSEKNMLEAFHQLNLARGVLSGQHFLMGLEYSNVPVKPDSPHSPESGMVRQVATRFLQAVANKDPAQSVYARDLLAQGRSAPLPELLQRYRNGVDVEVLYNKVDPFFVAALFYLLAGLLLIFPLTRNMVSEKIYALAFLVPVLFHAGGFATRVYITGFAPVTNMYGTMIWMAFGVALFTSILYVIYKHAVSTGLLLTASGLVLLLTHNMPLILSPDMDPVVAVLRSNFWLTIHVLTVTISYAAFTIAMLLGNAGLIHSLFNSEGREFYKRYSHYAYRMIQLGVLLLSAGIILGGVWADYSWGRFWGWDPKETWALIADLGFLMILHAKYVGWVRDFGLLASSALGYLLVLMAWYGVNFILATGLHSYGFSSGGATFVATFVGVQCVLLAASLGLRALRAQKA